MTLHTSSSGFLNITGVEI